MEPKRVYAKVRRGWNHVYLGFFWAGTAQEDKVATEVDAMLNRFPDAIASVSAECFGACAEFPVIGEFPLLDLSEPEKVKPTELNSIQRETLVALGDGVARMFTYKGVLTARALVTRGYAEKVNDGDGKWWIRITDAGREKLATMGHGIAEAAE